jgi:hypothetical protein
LALAVVALVLRNSSALFTFDFAFVWHAAFLPP